MRLLDFLKKNYKPGDPIFVKKVRVRGKSKKSIYQDFYIACKKGLLIRSTYGVYYYEDESKEFGSIATFEDIIEEKFIYSDECDFDCKELFV